MKKEIIISGLKLLFSINRISNQNGKLIILNYHQVSNHFDPRYNNLGTWNKIDLFKKQLLWLKERYRVISLAKGIELANNNLIDDDYVCLTFDDGDKTILKIIDILTEFNLPATFFINSGHLDNKSACWFNIYQFIKNSPEFEHLISDELDINVGMLRNTNDKNFYDRYSNEVESLFPLLESEFDSFVSYDDLANIDKRLFDVGSHGFNHQRFSMKDKNWQKQNIEKDIVVLSSLDSYKPIFGIPFGRPFDWNRDTIKIILDLGLDFVYANGGTNSERSMGYQRIPADNRKLKNII